eukprot:10032171-Ditylum_brightwellii.AAC.1
MTALPAAAILAIMPKAATLGEVTMAETEPMVTVVKVITLRRPGWREDRQNYCLWSINSVFMAENFCKTLELYITVSSH